MGYVYLYTGNGAGKTTGSLGVAIRALGHNQKVVVIQFLKWNRETGEYLFKHPNYEIYQFSSTEWIGVATLGDKDREACENGLATAYIKGKKEKTNLLILDEVNYAVSVGMLEESDVILMLKRLKNDNPKLNIVLTGRAATQGLINFADFANEIVEVKSNTKVCDEGIQY
jgi:cob(I)alamin adenosyltransferase